ncbi:uncharacterized protein LOC114719472 [Neltuma alba]|uniref:uncharacterized protein LOC114719472 n=1 Tax=Neltuma alba TaxID=207710 RepID=UPI0010A43952|nr:uncharacterized protein LOC114719472 [Prosopis alba]
MARSKSSNIFSSVLFCATTLMFLSNILNIVPKAQAARDMTISAEEATKCFSFLGDVPGCAEGMLGNWSLINHRCCKAILDESQLCWDKINPVHAEIPQIYKDYCTGGFLEPSSPSPSSSIETTQDLEQCWASLRNIEGCVGNIFYALLHGDFNKVGHECCQAVESTADECLFKMFPWNPFFPILLIRFCTNH